MVAHHPEEFGIQLGRERLNQASELSVCFRLALIGQIAGKDDCVGTQSGALQLLEQLAEPAVGVDRPVERAVRNEMCVADVQKDVIRPRMLRGPKSVHRRCQPLP
ncbi:hypothetical protein MHAE_05187 [Mycobacterium haemophilum DSM 44634]